jgi:hypothetical protein
MSDAGLDFTLDAVRMYRQRRQKEDLATKERKEAEYKAQVALESDLVSTFQVCPKDLLSIRQRLSSLDPKALVAALESRFYSADLQRSIACLMNALFLDGKVLPIRRVDLLREFITDLLLLKGGPAQEEISPGLAVISGRMKFNSSFISPRLFIYKTNGENPAQTIHEAVVGLYATNPLRREIPNFAYIYGLVQCPHPLWDGQSEVSVPIEEDTWEGKITLCPESSAADSSVLYENIPGQTLGEQLKQLKGPVIVAIYLQILLALQRAFEFCRFTHYDTTLGNVILRPVDARAVIRFSLQEGVRHCQTNGFVATIIDYETSYFEAQNEEGKTLSFGREDDREHPFIIEDAYKLLMATLQKMQKISHSDYKELLPLLKYFNPVDELDYFVRTGNIYTNPTPNNLRMTLPPLISFGRKWLQERDWPDPISEKFPSGGRLLLCTEKDRRCPSLDEELRSLRLIDEVVKRPT